MTQYIQDKSDSTKSIPLNLRQIGIGFGIFLFGVVLDYIAASIEQQWLFWLGIGFNLIGLLWSIPFYLSYLFRRLFK